MLQRQRQKRERERDMLKLAELAANDEQQEDEEAHCIKKVLKQLRKESGEGDEARAFLEEMQKNVDEAQARASATAGSTSTCGRGPRTVGDRASS